MPNECACRKALEASRENIQALEGCMPSVIYVYGAYGDNWSTNPQTDEYEVVDFPSTLQVIDAALAAPCECETDESLVADVYQDGKDERDKLRAELERLRKIEAAARWVHDVHMMGISIHGAYVDLAAALEGSR